LKSFLPPKTRRAQSFSHQISQISRITSFEKFEKFDAIGSSTWLLMKNRQQEDEIIQRLVQWAENQDPVRAMLLTSTRANPNASVDLLSDYDVVLVVPDIQPFYSDRHWLEAFGEVLVAYWDPIQPWPGYAIEYFGNVIQYIDGLKIDFTLWPIALFQQIVAAPQLTADLDDGYAILLDKDQLTEGMKVPTYTVYIPAPPSAETYQRMIEEFFSDAPYVAKCLWRDELLPAKWCLDYDMKHLYLRVFLEWRMELDHNWLLKTGNLGKGLKKQLPPAIWSQLQSAYAGAGIEENWDALLQTLAVFRRVAIEVGERLGYPYPYALDQQMTAYVEQIRQLEPKT
jgi:aminoglycoside 6-adenylyltransferase